MINNVLKMPKNSQKWPKNDKKVDICGSVGGGRNFYIPRKFFSNQKYDKKSPKKFSGQSDYNFKRYLDPPPKKRDYWGGVTI